MLPSINRLKSHFTLPRSKVLYLSYLPLRIAAYLAGFYATYLFLNPFLIALLIPGGRVLLEKQGFDIIEHMLFDAIPMGFISILLWEKSKNTEQELQEMEIAYLILQKKHHEKYTLYLRPFHVTARLRHNLWGMALLTQPFLREFDIDFERELWKVLRDRVPVLGLGVAKEAWGIPHIETGDQEWMKEAATLIDEGFLIICIPSAHPGTRWEVDYIVTKGYLFKTIFVVPPDTFRVGNQPILEIDEEWPRTVQCMKQVGVSLPQRHSRDWLFCSAKSTYGPVAIAMFKLGSRRSIRKAIADVIAASLHGGSDRGELS